ncbi:MAG: FHIPEP family type III secretion protein, partial [Thermoplasmatales archaeon]
NPDAMKEFIENTKTKMISMREKGYQELLLTDPALRVPLKKLLSRSFPNIGIISVGEIAEGYNVVVIEVI